MIVHTNLTVEEVLNELIDFISEHSQHELRYILAYAVGYYGAIDETVWEAIHQLIRREVIA